ncbi:hypothetical protein BGZ99_005489 [Dissophora globulifera]|uniref:RNB domain-containing protein n=1 Tax=Dissophora globulifera TaxID=979702 RepID=A0A9P6RIV4_9FUNG|nr:hypothetical protein BGZ99_005489 [Dissophora globulifera]
MDSSSSAATRTTTSLRRPELSPSALFMKERSKLLAIGRVMSERRAAKAERANGRAEQTTTESATAEYAFQPPQPVISEVSNLFGPESIQNRGVLPGDFVEVRKSGKPIYGIYQQDFDQEVGRLHSTSITQGDTILTHRTADVVFRIPGFLFMDRHKTAVGPWDPEINPDKAPPGAGKVATTFADEARSVMGTHYLKFNTVYNTFWNERNCRSVTIPEVARFVFDKEGAEAAPLTLHEVYATHLFLTEDINLLKFIPSIAVRWTGEFALRSPKDVALTETVTKWMRANDSKIDEFRNKAKLLLENYRRGDTSAWKGVTFSDSDRTIIEFVRQTAFTAYSDVFLSPHLAYLPRLLRPMDAYGDIDARTPFTFLTEIGVWPVWYNMEINRSAVSVTESLEEEQAIMDRVGQLHPESLQQDFEKELQQIRQHAAAADASRQTVQENDKTAKRSTTTTTTTTTSSPIVLQDPTELYRRDPCDDIRHDFGDQPIYAIDDPSASELDDAFSIEPVPITTLTPEPSTWVHVHVADPTSILPPLHEMAHLAADRVQTVYLPEGVWPMLPRDFTEQSLSLKDDGKPKKVLTFSARLHNETGEFLEYKIRPGYVRKVLALNYDDVDDHLQWDRVHGGKEEGMRVRNAVLTTPEVETGSGLDRQYYRSVKGTVDGTNTELVEGLIQLQEIARKHFDYRIRSGAFNFNMGRPMIQIAPYPLQPVAEEGWAAPVDYSTWQEPQISCRLDPSFASPSRMMVAEYMVMAGRIASQFAQDHGLPMLYRTQDNPHEKRQALLESIVREKTDPKTGVIGLVDMLPLRPYIPGAEISTTPGGHWSLGIHAGYCKVTSPLRRYSDMVAHWQIKNTLLSKHHGQSEPVFGLNALTPLTGLIRDRERMLGMLEARSIKFWLYEMLRRRLENGMVNEFEGVVMNPTADGYNVLSTLLGFQTVVKAEPEDVKDLKIGSKVLFEVNNCNPQRPWLGSIHRATLV